MTIDEIDTLTSSTQESGNAQDNVPEVVSEPKSTEANSIVSAPKTPTSTTHSAKDNSKPNRLAPSGDSGRNNTYRRSPKRGGFHNGYGRGGSFFPIPMNNGRFPMVGPAPFFPMPPPLMPLGICPTPPPLMHQFYGGSYHGTPQRPQRGISGARGKGGFPQRGRIFRASPARGTTVVRRSRQSFGSPNSSDTSSGNNSAGSSPNEKREKMNKEQQVAAAEKSTTTTSRTWEAEMTEVEDNEQGVTRPSKQFALATPTTDSRSSAPHRSLRTETGAVTYPLIYVSPAGTISVLLSNDVIIETAVDRSVRVVCHSNFSAFVNSKGTASSILHSSARILHTKETVYSKFMSSNDKMAVFGPQGVLFTMGHLTEAYLVNTSFGGASAIALDQLAFPPLLNDYTLKLFYSEAQTGNQFIPLCKDIVDEARYDRKADGTLFMHINGMMIRYTPAGDVAVDARPRHITCSPSSGTVHVRSAFIDVGVQSNEKAFVKCGAKRVHVSRSGMVVSDGNCITSMDHFGRIVSCT